MMPLATILTADIEAEFPGLIDRLNQGLIKDVSTILHQKFALQF